MSQEKTLLSMDYKQYSANRNDCVGLILDFLKINIKRQALPNNWWHNENNLIVELIKKIENKELSVKIKSFIFSFSALEAGDICFFRLRGKFAHHMGVYYGNGHVLHALPGRGCTIDFFRKTNRLFIFGVRPWA